MTKFFKNEDGSAAVEFGLALAFVSMIMLSGLMSLHNNLPMDISKLSTTFALHR